MVESSHLRVIGGAQFPSAHPFSDELIQLIEVMLTVEAAKRPFVPQVRGLLSYYFCSAPSLSLCWCE